MRAATGVAKENKMTTDSVGYLAKALNLFMYNIG
jgi:hypothetical protein